jgi:serine/threonine protein kinase/tetratricopeptide (TPR) repeat protein
MDPEREKRLNDLLVQVFDHPAEERRAFLEEACRGDDELFEEVMLCLGEETELGNFLEQPAAKLFAAETEVSSDDPPQALNFSTLQLGDYQILGHIDGGGMGDVYEGLDLSLGRKVALKVLPPDMSSHPEWLQRFQREARALATVNHPNIVTIHSVEIEKNIHFLTMELIEGRTLREEIRSRVPTTEELLEIAVPLADALCAAHECNITHRDLKPRNIMITNTGRVKILDFGIVSLNEADMGTEETLTADGQVLGTAAYMAPEQLEGEPVDGRADLFSLGIVLFELATGEHPFRRSDDLEHISALMNDDPVAMTTLRDELPVDLEKIVGRLLEKAPEDRYQSAAELRHDLEELRDGLRTEAILESRTDIPRLYFEPPRRPLSLALVVTLLLVLTASVVVLIEWRRWSSEDAAAVLVESQEARTSLAVLFFYNLGGVAELDWLSAGITEMLVTDLAKSPGLEVASTGQLRKILEKTGAPTAGPLSLAQIQDVASRIEGVEAVVLGTYVLLDGILRITFTIETPSGEILGSKNMEGPGGGSLFDLVEEGGTAIRQHFDAPRPELGPATIEEATTSSVDAWRVFSEGMRLLWRSEQEAAIAMFEKATEMDPKFGLAYRNLATAHNNLGHTEDARRYARLAFDLADRLPLNHRFSVEANYYGTSWSTNRSAIDTWRLGLRIYSYKRHWHNDLARRYTFFEEYQEAIEEYEKIFAKGTDFGGTYFNAANAYAALGKPEKGYDLLTEAIRKYPEDWYLHCSLGWYLTEPGNLEEAMVSFERATALQGEHYFLQYSRWRLEILRKNWPAAEREAEALVAFDDSFARWRGAVSLGRNALYRGRGTEALERFDEAILYSQGANRALARCFKAELLLALGEPGAALVEAQQAMEEGRDEFPELLGIYFAALAEEELGRSSKATDLLEVLRQRWLRQRNTVEERQIHQLAGLLALKRGDTEAAIESLRQAAALLPSKGLEFAWHVFPVHVPVWTSLGEAELAAGRPQAALKWLERATASGSEHLEQPLAYVRAFFFKSLAHQQLGETQEASQSLSEAKSFWPEGNLGRE